MLQAQQSVGTVKYVVQVTVNQDFTLISQNASWLNVYVCVLNGEETDRLCHKLKQGMQGRTNTS